MRMKSEAYWVWETIVVNTFEILQPWPPRCVDWQVGFTCGETVQSSKKRINNQCTRHNVEKDTNYYSGCITSTSCRHCTRVTLRYRKDKIAYPREVMAPRNRPWSEEHNRTVCSMAGRRKATTPWTSANDRDARVTADCCTRRFYGPLPVYLRLNIS